MLVAEGNSRSEVESWPLSRLWIEAQIVQHRIRQRAAMDVILIHVAIIDAIAGGGHLQETIEEMMDE